MTEDEYLECKIEYETMQEKRKKLDNFFKYLKRNKIRVIIEVENGKPIANIYIDDYLMSVIDLKKGENNEWNNKRIR